VGMAQANLDLCQKLGIMAFSTPFDETAVDFLETLNVACYKIASFESNHFPCLEKLLKQESNYYLKWHGYTIGAL